jgi:predicted amidohydrolase YtcJ
MSRHVDRLYANGRFVPWLCGATRDVSAIAVRDGLVVAAGDVAALRSSVSPDAEVVDLRGRFVTPGIVDAHTHLALFGLRGTLELDLSVYPQGNEVLDRVAATARTLPAGLWIRGSGLIPTADAGSVDRWSLDQVSPHHPVVLVHQTGHQLVVNSHALSLAAVDADTTDPPGSFVDRDRDGRPTGWMREFGAMALVQDRLPARTAKEWDVAIRWGQERYLEAGVVATKETYGGEEFEAVAAAYDRLADRGELALAPTLLRQVDTVDAARATAAEGRLDDGPVRRTGVKVFADGSLVARTAWLSEPYPGSEASGEPSIERDVLEEIVRVSGEGGLDVAIHAIGDAAVEQVAQVYADAPTTSQAIRSVVHAFSVRRPTLISLAESGCVIETQPALMTRLRSGYERSLDPARFAGLFPLRTVLDIGIPLGAGSDAPSALPDPGPGIAAATDRHGGTGEYEYDPSQTITRREALAAYTVGAARCISRSPGIGNLEPGSRGNLVAWDTDLLNATSEEVAAARPSLTVIGGEVVWAAPMA